MNKEFLDIFNNWMSTNLISYSWADDDVIIIPGFGKMYVFDSNSADKVFAPKESKGIVVSMELILPEPIGELIDDEIFYVALSWGDNFYYVDLREEVELKILKYLGSANIDEKYKFVNLGIHTPYELMNGSFSPQLWADKAKFLGHGAIGICDKNTLAGTLPLQKACSKAKIKHIFGYSLDVIIPAQPKYDFPEYMEAFDFDPYAEDHYDEYCDEVGEGIDEIKFGAKIYCLTDDGWANMLRIQKSVMVDNADNPHISIDELINRGGGNCFVFDKFSSTAIDASIIELITAHFDQTYFQWDMSEYKADRFDELVLIEGQDYLERWRNKLQPILISDNYYLDASDAKNKVLLNKIASGAAHQQSEDQYFKYVDEHIDRMRPLFDDIISSSDGEHIYHQFLEDMTSNTLKIANAATAKIETGVVFMPEYEMTSGEVEKYGDRRSMFLDLLDDGMDLLVSDEKFDLYSKRLDSEIYVIEASNNIDYFLILWDIVNNAKSTGIQTGVGRGSAGGSLVSYLLGLTTIDPMEYDLIFERFLTPERVGLQPQDVTILGDEIDITQGEKYIEIVTESGTFNVLPESEFIVNRGGNIIDCRADELQSDDDIIFDRKDEIWELPEIMLK